MSNIKQNPTFIGPFASFFTDFVKEKRASGYKYDTAVVYLIHLDAFLDRNGVSGDRLTREVVEQWATKSPNEQSRTHCSRVSIVRQFAIYLNRRGIPAYIAPPVRQEKDTFVPRIFTHEEIRIMFGLLDAWVPCRPRPYRHLVMPQLFRVLYGCGLRVGEAIHLNCDDVDWREGVLIVRGAKFGKERLVPMAPALTERLREYAVRRDRNGPHTPFFPATPTTRTTHGVVYRLFRELLWKMGIPHLGRNQGPRVHDLRHTFAVHRLLQWYREGADLNAMLPTLATYMGHSSQEGTQRYLHLVAELMPEVTERVEKSVGYVIPGGALS